jgi:hypothetical protein
MKHYIQHEWSFYQSQTEFQKNYSKFVDPTKQIIYGLVLNLSTKNYMESLSNEYLLPFHVYQCSMRFLLRLKCFLMSFIST